MEDGGFEAVAVSFNPDVRAFDMEVGVKGCQVLDHEFAKVSHGIEHGHQARIDSCVDRKREIELGADG